MKVSSSYEKESSKLSITKSYQIFQENIVWFIWKNDQICGQNGGQNQIKKLKDVIFVEVFRRPVDYFLFKLITNCYQKQ